MRPIAPRTAANDPELTIAEDQLEYRALPAAVVKRDGQIAILTRWQPTPDERIAIAEGTDIYVTILTRGAPLQPIDVQVGELAP